MIGNMMNKKLASFRIGGKKIELIPCMMTKSADSYSMKTGGLEVVLDLYRISDNFFRWMVRLKNIGSENTPQITELYGIDLDIPLSGEAVWESIKGDSCSAQSFMPLSEKLEDGRTVKASAEEGRSSQGGFPYFDISSDRGSAVFAVGWTGQWEYTVTRIGDTAAVRAGFTDCDMYLSPGECIRSVSGAVCFGCDILRTRQYFRRIFREKLSPAAKYGGHMETPLSLQVFDRYFRQNPDWATEEGQLHCIRCADKCGYFNTYWLDAAWFRDGFPHGVGNYEFEAGFPRGLAPVSDLAHRRGLNFVLWFEPERNFEGSDAVNYRSHQLLSNGDPNEKNFLYDLTSEDSFVWLRNTLIRMIRDNGIDVYRQDFNMNPLTYWRHNDPENKKGYTENRYITNLYRLWDALLDEFPGLLIDNCSSGGRRLDFEMNMRSIPLWRSDTGCFPSSDASPTYLWHQNQTLGLSRYLPYHSSAAWTTDSNIFRSAATMGIACNFDVMNPDFDAEDAKKPLCEISETREYWDGDFIPLTDASLDTDVWCAWQLHHGNAGFCIFFRRHTSEDNRKTFDLDGLLTDRDYEITLSDSAYRRTIRTVKGSELASFTAEIPEKNSSLVMIYKLI